MAIWNLLPWYIWALGIIVAGFIIWHYLPNWIKFKVQKIFTSPAFYIILFIIIWIFWATRRNIVEVNQANFWMPVLGLFILFVYSTYGMLQYKTNQVITPNFHGSYSKVWEDPEAGLVILNIGAVNYGVNLPVAWKILVVRKETFELLQDSAISIARVAPVSIYDLPPSTKKLIESNLWLKPAKRHIYYGWFDDINQIDWDFDNWESLKKYEEWKESPKLYNLIKKELDVDNPKISTLYWQFKNLAKAANKQTEYYDATVEAVEKGVEHAQRVRMAYDVPKEERKAPEGYEEY